MKSRMQQDSLSINVATEGGRTVPEAHAPGTGWIDVDFSKAMCIAWNWDDLLQDASAPEENLTVADGFYEGGRNCADSLKDYISSFDGADRENTILFITGYSLGAATANVVGRLSREYAKAESNTDDVVPTVPYRIPPHYFSKIGRGCGSRGPITISGACHSRRTEICSDLDSEKRTMWYTRS